MNLQQAHPLTRLLLLDLPDHNQQKYPQAIIALNLCSNSMSSSGVSKNLVKSIEAAQHTVKDLQQDLLQRKIFFRLLEESCFDLINGTDAKIKPEVQNLLEALMLAKMGTKGMTLVQLMGIPAEYQASKFTLSPHTVHVLQLVMSERIKERYRQVQSRHKNLSTVQNAVLVKMLNITDLISRCSKILDKNELGALSKKMKNLDNIENRVQCLIEEHNLQYYSLKKNELVICKQMLGLKGPENLPAISSQLKQEHEEQSKRNQEKRNRLELYEGLGPEYRKLADKHLEMDKKIKYTKLTLDQLDAMFK